MKTEDEETEAAEVCEEVVDDLLKATAVGLKGPRVGSEASSGPIVGGIVF